MTFKKALLYSAVGLMLGLPLAGCGDDDDSSSDQQTGGSSSKAGSKSSGTSGSTHSMGGRGNSAGAGDVGPVNQGGAPAMSDGGEPGVIDPSCDPKGANPEMGALLNAPVDSDVEVIVKKPQHPGKPGPKDLP